MRTRSLVVAVVAWVSVVAVASGVTWLVIDSAGQDLLTADTPVAASLTPSPPRAGTRAPRAEPSAARSTSAPARSARPSTAPSPDTTPSASSPAPAPAPAPSSPADDDPPTPVSRSDAWTGAQGTVAVTCTGPRITGRSVTPNDGWHAEVEGSAAGEVEVKVESGERATPVKVRCVGGVPRFQVEQD